MRKTLPLAAAALLSTVFAIPASAQEADQQLLLKQPQAGATSKQQDATPDQAQGAAEQKSDQQSNTAGAEQPKKESSKDAAAAERSQNNADEAASVKPKESDKQNTASQSDEENSDGSKNAASKSEQPNDQKAAAGTQEKEDGTVAGSKQDRVNADTAKSDSQDETTKNAARASEDQDVSKETTASVDITTEQRTEIRQVIVRDAPPPVHLDINVSVGVEVPHTVELRPLPPRVIKIVPQYKGYRFFVLADGRIIIVQPKTYKVVYVLTA